MTVKAQMAKARRGANLLRAAKAFARRHGHKRKSVDGWIYSKTGLPLAPDWQTYARMERSYGRILKRRGRYVDSYSGEVL